MAMVLRFKFQVEPELLPGYKFEEIEIIAGPSGDTGAQAGDLDPRTGTGKSHGDGTAHLLGSASHHLADLGQREVHQRLRVFLPVTTSNTTLVFDMGLCLSTTSRPRSTKRIGQGTVYGKSQWQRYVSSCFLHLLAING